MIKAFKPKNIMNIGFISSTNNPNIPFRLNPGKFYYIFSISDYSFISLLFKLLSYEL